MATWVGMKAVVAMGTDQLQVQYGKCGLLCLYPACRYVGEHIVNITKKNPKLSTEHRLLEC